MEQAPAIVAGACFRLDLAELAPSGHDFIRASLVSLTAVDTTATASIDNGGPRTEYKVEQSFSRVQ
jgi:hypothetical protein